MLSRRSFIVRGPTALAASALLPNRLFAQPLALRTPQIELGPFYPIAKPHDHDADLTLVDGHRRHAQGQVIELSGRVMDTHGLPVAGATIELWQANAAGRYAHPSDPNPASLDPDFQGYARLLTGRDGVYRVITIRPGAYPTGPNRLRTPHIHMIVDGRFDRLATQMFFPGEPLNARDGIYQDMSSRSQQLATAQEIARAEDGRRRFVHDLILATG